MTCWNEYEDAISDAISDSIDMDWTSRTGAKAVVAWLNENAAASAPSSLAGGEVNDEWADRFCEAVNWSPDGEECKTVEGELRCTTFRQIAKGFILSAIATNPYSDNAALSPEAPAREGATHPDAQPFERFPELALHIERMAMTGLVGSMISWDAFLRELNAALTPRHEAPADDGPVFHMNLLSHEDNEAWLESARRVAAKHEAPAEGAGERELLPCPFCGGDAEIVHIEDGENEGGSCVCCTVCQASGNLEFERKENFISNWNRRARSSAPEAREGEAVERKADGLAHLVAAISLLKRAEEIGKKPSMATGSKKMFDQMLRDYEGAANRMRKAIYTHPAAPSADKLREDK